MKRLLSLIISCAFLWIIFSRVNTSELIQSLQGIDFFYLSLALLLFLPLIIIPAWRWQYVSKSKAHITLQESTRLILASSCLNLFLPSKMGDLCKAYFLNKHGHVAMSRGINLVLFERYLDTAALSVMALIGAALSSFNPSIRLGVISFSLLILTMLPIALVFFTAPGKHTGLRSRIKLPKKLQSFFDDTQNLLHELKRRPETLIILISVSLFLWFLHLTQFYFIFQALHSNVPCMHIFALVPVAIFTGMIPITAAGVGSRDAALLVLFSPYAPSSQIVIVGLFATLRYLVPGILGVFFLSSYMVNLKGTTREES